MKKVTHIIIGLEVGGAELMLKRLVTHSNRQSSKFEHTVISLTNLGVIGFQLQQEGAAVYQLGMHSVSSVPKTFYKLRKLLKKIQPDVVQTWMYHADFLGGLAAKSVGVKNIIWGIRTTDVSQGASALTVQLSKLCAKLSYIIPNTIVCAAQVSKDYHIGIGYDESKMVVIPNGFDLEALHATEEEGFEIRRQNNLSEDDIVIGSIGRFNPVKNQKLFVEVAAKLVEYSPDLKFMMVGRDNTVDNEELMSWINGYNLQQNFRLLGQRSDIPQCLKAMDIFCLHSKTEGFPNILIEAILQQTYVISTDVGEVKYLLPSLYISQPTPDSFSKKIVQCISNKHYYHNKDIELISLRYSKDYSIEKCVSEFEKLYVRSHD